MTSSELAPWRRAYDGLRIADAGFHAWAICALVDGALLVSGAADSPMGVLTLWVLMAVGWLGATAHAVGLTMLAGAPLPASARTLIAVGALGLMATVVGLGRSAEVWAGAAASLTVGAVGLRLVGAHLDHRALRLDADLAVGAHTLTAALFLAAPGSPWVALGVAAAALFVNRLLIRAAREAVAGPAQVRES